MAPDVTLSHLQTDTPFSSPTRLKEFLAQQLIGGRLALILGAGVSVAFRLPAWDELIGRMSTYKAATIAPELSNDERADALLLEYCNGDDLEFARLVRRALYEGYDHSFETLRRNDLLAALGALAMASSRGSVTKVVTFNFDDLFENYLTYFGFQVEAIWRVPCWASRVDVRVYHPHGLLPILEDSPRGGVVLAKIHYDRVIGGARPVWRNEIVELFRTHTCLFIGLSGADDDLTSLLTQAQTEHVSRLAGEKYWGFRFSLADDVRRSAWQGRGVSHIHVSGYDEIPRFLFEVCQAATRLHRTYLLS